MILCLAGLECNWEIFEEKLKINPEWNNFCELPILMSFYYITNKIEKRIKIFDTFFLDSGAFTFFSSGKTVVWEEYIDKYAEFINRNKIKHFFELDIDCLVGVEKTLLLRERLEKATGRQSIPVWHISRGIEQFKKDADSYSYVALGGIVSGEWGRRGQQIFPWFIKEAHRRGAKIHGLGYTSLSGIEKNHFDSVDSTSWTCGNRFGYLDVFDGSTIKKRSIPPGKKLIPFPAKFHNFNEWVKFSNYARYKF